MVTVWLPTRDDLKDGLELALYDASNVKAPKPIDVTTDHQVVRAGAKLFIHLMVARPGHGRAERRPSRAASSWATRSSSSTPPPPRAVRCARRR